MAILGRLVIDIVKLDKYLMKTYKYKGSMNDFVLEKYGKEAQELINKTIGYKQ